MINMICMTCVFISIFTQLHFYLLDDNYGIEFSCQFRCRNMSCETTYSSVVGHINTDRCNMVIFIHINIFTQTCISSMFLSTRKTLYTWYICTCIKPENGDKIIMTNTQLAHSLNYLDWCLFWINLIDWVSMEGGHLSIHCFYSFSPCASSQLQGPEYDITLIPTPTREFHRYDLCYLQQVIHGLWALFVAIVWEECEHFHNSMDGNLPIWELSFAHLV